MSQVFNTNNPGIGDVYSLTVAETEFIDSLIGLSYVEGDIIYIDATGNFNRLAIGTDGQVLTVNDTATAPQWETPAGGGNVSNTGTPADNQIAVFTDATTIEGASDFTFDGADLIFYNAANDGNPEIRLGAADAEELHIQTVYVGASQNLDYVLFTTDTVSASADRGLYRFNVDGTSILDIDDGGINLAASKGISVAGTDIITDSAGTATLSNIDALDATTEATIEAAIDTLANLTSIQGVTVTLADAGANAILGWDDAAGAYENLTQAEVLAIIGDAVADGATKGVASFTAADFDVASGVVSIDYTNAQKASTAQSGFVAELATTTETNTGTDTTRAVTPDGLSSAVKSIMLTAAGGAPLTTAGCSEPTKVEAATNDINYYVLDFDSTTEEHAFWSFVMPENWDAGTVTAQFYWTNASGLTTETVDWGIAGGSWADGDAIDAALGTEVTTTDTWLAQGDLHISPKSTAVTIANATAGEWVNIVVARKVASDNLTGDARLIAVKLTYTIDQYSDEI